jgi:hypothetical protein
MSTGRYDTVRARENSDRRAKRYLHGKWGRQPSVPIVPTTDQEKAAMIRALGPRPPSIPGANDPKLKEWA